MRDFQLDTSQWHMREGPYEVRQLSVSAAELVWPSWRQQVLRVRVTGLRLEVLQHSMVQVSGCARACSAVRAAAWWRH